MDDDEKEHSESLFLKDSGEEMRFYIRPCKMKARIRPLVEHGGGRVSSKIMPDAIKLAEPDSHQVGYFSTDFIFDSVKKNKLQNLDDYRIVMPSPSSTTSNVGTAKGGENSRKSGRNFYTPEEDKLIIEYVEEHRSVAQLSGNVFWKSMVKAGIITSHSWQSLRDHYLKHLKQGQQRSKHCFITRTRTSKKGEKKELTILEGLNRGSPRSPKKGSVNKSTKEQESSDRSVDSDESDRGEAEMETAEDNESDASAEFDVYLHRLAEKEHKTAVPDKDRSRKKGCTESQRASESSDCEVTSSQGIKKPANKHKNINSALKKEKESRSYAEDDDNFTGDKSEQKPMTRGETSKRKLLTGSRDGISTSPAKQKRQSPQASGVSVSPAKQRRQSPQASGVSTSPAKQRRQSPKDSVVSTSPAKQRKQSPRASGVSTSPTKQRKESPQGSGVSTSPAKQRRQSPQASGVFTSPTKQRRQSPQANGDAGAPRQSFNFKSFWNQFKKLQDMEIDLQVSTPVLLYAVHVASGVQGAKDYILQEKLKEGEDEN